jgi:hypothetical protein
MTKFRVGFLLFLLVALAGCNSAGPGGQDFPEGVLYQDDFASDQGNWLLESDLEATAAVLEGQLRVTIDSANLIAWAELAEQEFSDFVLTVDASQIAGPDNNSYGVVFRKQDPSAYYRFDISGDGYYALTRRDKADGGKWTWITSDWLRSDAINLGAATNQIEIVAEGSHFTISVNGEQVVEADDTAYRSGAIGLDAGSFNESGVVIGFDNLLIREP